MICGPFGENVYQSVYASLDEGTVTYPVIFNMFNELTMHEELIQTDPVDSNPTESGPANLSTPTGVKPATINRYLSSIKTIMRFKKQQWDFRKRTKEAYKSNYQGRGVERIDLLQETKPNERNYFFLLISLILLRFWCL